MAVYKTFSVKIILGALANLRKRPLASSYLLECSASGGISVKFRVGLFY